MNKVLFWHRIMSERKLCDIWANVCFLAITNPTHPKSKIQSLLKENMRDVSREADVFLSIRVSEHTRRRCAHHVL